ncbi:transposase family protein [Enterococcus sp. DIV0187]|uniref:transposase family protein n=1 Tax=Enterococcus sp. DIV0187 TaxID=2774644 RepID=UPI003F1ED714
MEELLLSLDVNLHVDDCQITNEKITFDVSSISTSAKCPTCRCKSTNIHDSYTTKIQDLPIQSKTVYLNLLIRRFKCQNPDCSKKTFSETFPFREGNAQKTTRLMKLIVDLAESRSSVGMTKDLEEMGIIVRKSSLCNYLGQKKNSRRL